MECREGEACLGFHESQDLGTSAEGAEAPPSVQSGREKPYFNL